MSQIAGKRAFWVLYFCLLLNALKADLLSNEKRIADLEKNVATLQSQSLASEQKYAALISNILAKLSANSNEIPRLRSGLDSLQQEHNQTLHALDWTRRELRLLASQYSDLKAKHDSIANEIIMNRSDLDTAVENITDLVEVVSRVQSYIHELPNVTRPSPQVENASLLADTIQLLHIQENNIVVLENKVNQTERNIQSAQVNVATNTRNEQTDAADIKLIQTDIINLKAEGSNFQRVLQLQQANIADHAKQIAASTAKAQQSSSRLGTLQSQLNANLKKYNQQFVSQDGRITANGKNVAALTTGQGALRTRISNLETRLALTNNRLATAQQKLAKSPSRLFFQINLGHDQMFGINVPLALAVGKGSTYGPYYNTRTGKFTALTAGVYVFWINVEVSTHALQTTLDIIKQGSVIARGTAGTGPVVVVTRVKLHEQVWFTKSSGNSASFKSSLGANLGGVLLYTL